MDINILLSVLRTVMYLWIAIEFSNLTYLYWVGYHNTKATPIIKALQVMFFFLSLRSLVYAFLPILLVISPEWHKAVVSYLPIVLIPIGFAVRKFREESLNRQTMKLPDHRKDKKKNE